MDKKIKIILIIISFFVLLIILGEIGILNIVLYTANFQGTNNLTRLIENQTGGKSDKTGSNVTGGETYAKFSLKLTPKSIAEGTTLVFSEDFTVISEDLSLKGIVIFPVVKDFSLSFHGEFKQILTNIEQEQVIIEIDSTYNFTIFGICSIRYARIIALEKIQNLVTKYLNEKLSETD